jgi:hypothetical protein
MSNNSNFSLCLFVLLVTLSSCQQEETLLPVKSQVKFSISEVIASDGRSKQTVTPAFVKLSLKDGSGDVQELIKLRLYDFGQAYLSETLELLVGEYQLTHFEVLDEAGKTIYATPSESSDLAKYVADPLPLNFLVKNEGVRVTPQVLPVQDDVLAKQVNINIHLQYPALTAFDSAYIVFTNDSTELKYTLTLDNLLYVATGHVPIPVGNWKISTSYFGNIIANYKSLETAGTVELQVSNAATDLISNETNVFIKHGSGSADLKVFHWEKYYYYQLFLGNTIEGFARIPTDPTNPFIEVTTFQSKWIYLFTSRSFYNRRQDGSSYYHQRSCAFEVYGKSGDSHDRLEKRIIDTTSLQPGILQVKDKTWNYVDGLIILYDDQDNELLFFDEWDLRTSTGG